MAERWPVDVRWPWPNKRLRGVWPGVTRVTGKDMHVAKGRTSYLDGLVD